MPSTYTQIYIHTVFTVQNRMCLIHKSWKDELYKYITGIVKANKHKLIAINGMPDHLHILIGMKPHQSLSDLMQDIKGSSSKWINEKKFLKTKFQWQQGYGAFSYSHSHLNKIIKHIQDQEIHHKKKTFKEELKRILTAYNIEF
ncbi:MAG: IS200/IS605 family transposase, partial [Bacteroidetes bacterium]|nr:IS200/IS605 family transposase [Bacteroidota bacterium]